VHVGGARRQPYPRAGQQGDHARRLPFTIAASPDSVAATTAPLIRIRAPLANSILIIGILLPIILLIWLFGGLH
jgi:hypothetical protein